MDALKKIFPLSFKKMNGAGDLVLGILVYIVVAIVATVALVIATKIARWIPAIGDFLAWLLGIVGGLVDLYAFVGIVLQILVFANVLKD